METERAPREIIKLGKRSAGATVTRQVQDHLTDAEKSKLIGQLVSVYEDNLSIQQARLEFQGAVAYAKDAFWQLIQEHQLPVSEGLFYCEYSGLEDFVRRTSHSFRFVSAAEVDDTEIRKAVRLVNPKEEFVVAVATVIHNEAEQELTRMPIGTKWYNFVTMWTHARMSLDATQQANLDRNREFLQVPLVQCHDTQPPTLEILNIVAFTACHKICRSCRRQSVESLYPEDELRFELHGPTGFRFCSPECRLAFSGELCGTLAELPSMEETLALAHAMQAENSSVSDTHEDGHSMDM
jgi:hypothetical protein